MATKNLHACGVWRSGSTFVYNVLNRIKLHYNAGFYNIATKTHIDWHTYVKKNDISFFTYRDPRNVCASWIRFNISNKIFTDKGNGTYSVKIKNTGQFNTVTYVLDDVTVDQIVNDVIWMHNKINEKIKNDYRVLVMKYEDEIFKDNKIAIRNILEFLKSRKIYVDESFIEQTSNDLNIEKVKKDVMKIHAFGKDIGTEFWFNHINDGISDHKTYFKNNELDLIKDTTKFKLEEYCKTYGYE